MAFCLAMVGLGFSLPFLPESKPDPIGALITAILCITGFGFYSILIFLKLGRLPSADISTDQYGIHAWEERKD